MDTTRETVSCGKAVLTTAVFVPNNDVSPARRIRINKALEFGASWARTWQDQITHVIVDSELCFEDVMSYLKLKSFPVSYWAPLATHKHVFFNKRARFYLSSQSLR